MVGNEEIAVGAGDHVVQFYARAADLARSVARYIAAAVQTGSVAVVIATDEHHRLFAAELAHQGVDVVEALTNRSLVRLDAAATLASFMTEGRIDAAAFHQVLGSAIGEAGAQGRAIRAYGEMVALLWDAGQVGAAIELEGLWNELVAEHRCSLLCAYRSSSVTRPEHARAVQRVCQLHSAVAHPSGGERVRIVGRRSPAVEVCAEFPAQAHAPRSARRFVIDALRRGGHTRALVGNAQLVVSELATNAVVHARTGFSVAVRHTNRVVLLSVADRSPVPPATPEHRSDLWSGRGLQLVAALASDWGTEFTAEGKTVWAELPAGRPAYTRPAAERPNARRPRGGHHIQSRATTIRVLDVDPELAAGIHPEQRKAAADLAVAPIVWHQRGPWQFVPDADPATEGVLVLDGLIIIRLAAGARAHTELLCPGDLTSPWIALAPDLSVPSIITASVLSRAQLALLDRDFASRTARWPELHAAFVQRLIARTRRLSLQAAINAHARIDQRIELTLWQLADRLGQVTSDGITLHLPITHSQLAEIVGAHRPTVTSALSHLQGQGRVIRTSPDQWLLHGPAPSTLPPLNERSS